MPGRRSRAQLRGQRPAARRGRVRRTLGPAGGRRRGRGARRGPGRIAPPGRAPRPRARGRGRDGGRTARPRLPRPRDRGVPGARRLPRRTAAGAGTGRAGGGGAGAGPGGGLVPGADGVRPAGAGQPVDPRRPARSGHAVHPQPQDQVPRVLPPVRPRRAGRGRQGLVRSAGREPLHAADGAGGRGPATGVRGRGRRRAGPGPAARTALDGPRGHPCRRLGPGADGDGRAQPAFPRAAHRLPGAHGLPGAGEHVLQCARGADRARPGGGVRLLHAHPDRSPRPRRPSPGQARPARVAGGGRLACHDPEGLNGCSDWAWPPCTSRW
ncbi:conserved hypothetical protein [Streptomyces misionensis JCM 4497]